jgi:hypothetical protein
LSRDVVIVAGAIGRANVGGKAWVYLQYLLGLQQLGFDVYYLEDSGEGSWVYDWESDAITTDPTYPARFIDECLAPHGFGSRWVYRSGDDSHGLSLGGIRQLCDDARLLIVHGDPIPIWRSEYDLVHRRIFVDLDPGFTQLRLATGDRSLVDTVDRCERLFTIGQRVGEPDCLIPDAGRQWIPTRPPVDLTHWYEADTPVPADAPFTAVMDWRGFRDIEYEGQVYGQKDREFPAYLDVPSKTRQPLLLALTGTSLDRVTAHGWRAVPGWEASRTTSRYEEFIRTSRAEFGVAKHGYVKSRGGWFSDRSVCYLASGKPVLLQDTGQASCLPVGRGVVIFSDPESAVAAIDHINEDYAEHCRSARTIAEQFFDARLVLSNLLQDAF